MRQIVREPDLVDCSAGPFGAPVNLDLWKIVRGFVVFGKLPAVCPTSVAPSADGTWSD